MFYSGKMRIREKAEAFVQLKILDYIFVCFQPLMDNLESGTYEVFEKDPTKYSQYQKVLVSSL